MPRRTLAAVIAAGTSVTLTSALMITGAHADGHSAVLAAHDDAYLLQEGRTLSAHDSILDNDSGRPVTLVSHTQPAHGALTLSQDGTFQYVPAAGFSGVDTFSYTVSDAVQLYQTHLPPLATIGGVNITAGGYGSSLAPVPGSNDEYYGLTDRGPNVTAPDGVTKIEPLPSFDPAIGKFKLVGTDAVLEKKIPLEAGDGTPYNGLVNSQASTGETIEDLNGVVQPTSPYGYDSEGLVALKDGTFWVSDEYGPFITHFDSHGRQIGRLSPFDGSLPAELAMRVPNKGMEGLTITPDGKTLVGMMQSALQTPDLTKKPASVTTLRIVTYDLKTAATHEYLYLLDDPKTNSGAVSEITALSNTTFVVDERDGNFEPGAYKKLFKIDITGATDVGPHSTVPGATYNAAAGGLLVGPAPQKSIDAFVSTDPTATATTDLAGVGITPVSKTLDVDLGGLLTSLDPTGGFFGHDKVEGVATTDGGGTLVVSNDNDFGIVGVTNAAPPFTLQAKILPNGQQDDGEYLAIDTTRLADPTSTATVSIFVTPPGIHR
jgi:Esterase-like activity of phytase/Bacterial Ig domain